MIIEFKTLAGARHLHRLARRAILLVGMVAWTNGFSQGHPFSHGDTSIQDDPVPPVARETVVSPVKPIWLQNPWTGDTQLVRVPEPDPSLWNATRIDDYNVAIEEQGTPPLALFTINRLGDKVPVYNGTDDFNLDRGLGRIQGMARIHDDGHLGISGHRD